MSEILVIVALALVVAQSVALLVMMDRASKRHAEELRHLTHIAIAQHVGEVRTLDQVAKARDEDRIPFPVIEGL